MWVAGCLSTGETKRHKQTGFFLLHSFIPKIEGVDSSCLLYSHPDMVEKCRYLIVWITCTDSGKGSTISESSYMLTCNMSYSACMHTCMCYNLPSSMHERGTKFASVHTAVLFRS